MQHHKGAGVMSADQSMPDIPDEVVQSLPIIYSVFISFKTLNVFSESARIAKLVS